MSKKPLVWSPNQREAYTVNMPDGTKGGIGAREIFTGRPGLWNMCWLHSARIDEILDWPEDDADNVPGYSTSVAECESSAYEVCGGVTIEELAAYTTPQKWVQKIVENNLHPPIRKFWDDCKHNSWLSIVEARMKLSRYYTESNGGIISVNF